MQTALACPDVGPLIEKAGLSPWQGLCLHLLFERAKGCKSTWDPYISLLPSELDMVEQHPLFWPQVLLQVYSCTQPIQFMFINIDMDGLLQELCDELLAGSPMLAKLKRRINQCKYDLFQYPSFLSSQIIANSTRLSRVAGRTMKQYFLLVQGP